MARKTWDKELVLTWANEWRKHPIVSAFGAAVGLLIKGFGQWLEHLSIQLRPHSVLIKQHSTFHSDSPVWTAFGLFVFIFLMGSIPYSDDDKRPGIFVFSLFGAMLIWSLLDAFRTLVSGGPLW